MQQHLAPGVKLTNIQPFTAAAKPITSPS